MAEGDKAAEAVAGAGGSKETGSEGSRETILAGGDPAKTPEQLAAAKAEADKGKTPEQLAAEKTETERREKLTPEQRKAEDDAKAKAAAGAPDKYEDFKMPEGFTPDKAALESFLPIAKELDLNQDKAQKLVDWDTARQQKHQESQEKYWDDLIGGWVKSAKEDKEFGGAKFDESVGRANAVIAKFGTPELKQALQSTQIGNHPELIRLLNRVGVAIGEDKLVVGGGQGPAGDKPLHERMYKTN